jgi:hypothetical protein
VDVRYVVLGLALLAGCAALPRIRPTGDPPIPPRLVVRPAGDVSVSGRGASRVLRFEMTVENQGTGPLEVLGRRDGSRTLAMQRVYGVDARRNIAVDHELAVGELYLDEHHGHWHLDGFARFQLLDERLAPARGARAASKTSACLLDAERLADTNGDADALPSYTTCQPDRQGISPGWADVYGSDLPGQEIAIGGLPDGTYWLVITLTAPFESAGPGSDRVAATHIAIDARGARVLERLYGAGFVERFRRSAPRSAR